jgi:selenocysteine-specific elongation factor
MRPFIIATAGHIDHGKSALLKALTGTDPDRLEEEKRRGLTIDIRFAFLGGNIAFIDVPGHERFIKNMVTGASTADMAMLVIAADDGIMPQTIEHLDILKLLGVQSGLIVVTKIDLVNDEWLKLVENDIKAFVKGTFLENAPIFKVSSSTGENIENLKAYLLSLTFKESPREDKSIFHLPVDRVFTLKGYGTIVTGSVLSGRAKVRDEIEILPLGKKARIRSIQSHNKDLESISIGYRAALNLQGIEKEFIRRGQSICTPGYFTATNLLTCKVETLSTSNPLKYNQKIRVHLGTGEYICNIRFIGVDELHYGESAIAQIVFEEKVSAGFKDRFIIRSYSPLSTIGGGIVLDVSPSPIRKKSTDAIKEIDTLINGDISKCIEWFIKKSTEPLSVSYLSKKLSLHKNLTNRHLHKLEDDGKVIKVSESYIHTSSLPGLKNRVIEAITDFHKRNPLLLGIKKSELFKQISIDENLGDWILKELKKKGTIFIQNEKVALSDYKISLTDKQKEVIEKIEDIFVERAFKPPTFKELVSNLKTEESEAKNLIEFLIDQHKLIVVSQDMIFHREIIERGEKVIRDFLMKKGKATVSEIKDILNTSRKWVLPLLNYYDRIKITKRKDDYRLPF